MCFMSVLIGSQKLPREIITQYEMSLEALPNLQLDPETLRETLAASLPSFAVRSRCLGNSSNAYRTSLCWDKIVSETYCKQRSKHVHGLLRLSRSKHAPYSLKLLQLKCQPVARWGPTSRAPYHQKIHAQLSASFWELPLRRVNKLVLSWINLPKPSAPCCIII